MNESLMDVNQVAEYLGMKPQTIYLWVSKRQIPFVKVGRCTRFDPGAVRRWVNRHAKHPKTFEETTSL